MIPMVSPINSKGKFSVFLERIQPFTASVFLPVALYFFKRYSKLLVTIDST